MIDIMQEVSLIGKVVHFWDTCANTLPPTSPPPTASLYALDAVRGEA